MLSRDAGDQNTILCFFLMAVRPAGPLWAVLQCARVRMAVDPLCALRPPPAPTTDMLPPPLPAQHTRQVAYKVPWTAISSLLGQLSRRYGPQVGAGEGQAEGQKVASHGPMPLPPPPPTPLQVLLQLNLAYMVPAAPILLLQSLATDRLDAHLGPARSAAARLTAGYAGLAVLCVAFPWAAAARWTLLAATGAVGCCYALAFGTSYQLAARFPAAATVALTTGVGVGHGLAPWPAPWPAPRPPCSLPLSASC